MNQPKITIENCRVCKNRKSGDIYRILTMEAENATNRNAGQYLVIYCNEDGEVFAREANEFFKKFEIT